ncbi:MAG: HEAT repeat domain-containing protein, partial [Bacteroidales bacterium]|nr:HEAT repeat domain-containing protein [Bacteroidales bacterium]
MKSYKTIIATILLLAGSFQLFSQDNRTPETKVADILARMPARSSALTDALVADILALGDQGIKMICSQVIPAGTGDDTKARFAIESLSRYLSAGGRKEEQESWEKTCIGYVKGSSDNGVTDFFMKQLQLVGGDESAAAMKAFLNNRDLCGPAVGVLMSVKGSEAEKVLAASLKDNELKCPAAVINALAAKGSQLAVNEYLAWAQNSDFNIKSAALNALAKSGSPQARNVLLKAAADVNYIWEGSGATASLIEYADVIAAKGDVQGMDKICRLLMSKCNDKTNIQGKIAALTIYTRYNGADALL